ncbi:MAG: hypothetical protein RDV41_10965 [Planctomycetota bacterium]|nr:hypothetical protein [Planctomycetota bacterium]
MKENEGHTGAAEGSARTPRVRRATACLVVAIFLAAFGVMRYTSDILTDAYPGWHSVVEGTWLRYLMRAPSDGTLWGYVSVQYFKILAVPCGISGVFVLYRLFAHDLAETDRHWRLPEIRALYVLALLFAFTLMEFEKATHFIGLRMAGLLAGERAWVNHVLHVASAAMGWLYMRWLIFVPEPATAGTSGDRTRRSH